MELGQPTERSLKGRLQVVSVHSTEFVLITPIDLGRKNRAVSPFNAGRAI